MFLKEPDEEDWSMIKKEIGKLECGGSIKELKDYTLIAGELYRKLPGGILSTYISEKEGKLNLQELHNQTYKVIEKVSLYRRMQHMG